MRLLFRCALFFALAGLLTVPFGVAAKPSLERPDPHDAQELVAAFLGAMKDNDVNHAALYFINPSDIEIITPNVFIFEGALQHVLEDEFVRNGERWKELRGGSLASINTNPILEFMHEGHRWECHRATIVYELSDFNKEYSFELTICNDAEEHGWQWKILGHAGNMRRLTWVFPAKDPREKYIEDYMKDLDIEI